MAERSFTKEVEKLRLGPKRHALLRTLIAPLDKNQPIGCGSVAKFDLIDFSGVFFRFHELGRNAGTKAQTNQREKQ